MVNPVVADFKTYFFRDFPYGTSLDKITDADIQKGIDQASYSINPSLFASQSEYNAGFLNLAAHYLVMDIRASSQGISGNYPWMETSKSVGSVSQGFQIPQHIVEHPILGMLSKTYYGSKYLSMVLTSLVGQIYAIEGGTQA